MVLVSTKLRFSWTINVKSHAFTPLCTSSSYEAPTLIQALAGKPIVQIACGSEYSAAITTTGDLYMWGRGTYGRLGVGSSDDLNVPTQVSSSYRKC